MPYLLSTLLTCTTCGGTMHATKRTGRRARPRVYYVCTTHRVRGDHYCVNKLSAPMEDLDAAIREQLVAEILTPDFVDDVVRETLARAARRASTASRPRLEAELERVQKELKHYAVAIAKKGPLSSLLEEVGTRERRREALRAELTTLDRRRVPERPADDLKAAAQRRLDEWRQMLERHPEKARQTVLQPLLGGKISMTPKVTTAGRFYEFAAPVSYGGLVTGLIGAGDGRVITVVPPG